MRDRKIKVEHITRVEGHGNIEVEVEDGRLVRADFDIVESPRFFEVMLKGRMYTDAAWIASRICGICAVAHTTASLRATEDAFGITPSEQTRLLRRVSFNGEVIQSHILHLYFLVAPDFLGAGSVFDLVGSHSETVNRALRLKKLGNDLCAAICGRHVHPVSMAVGGFTALPKEKALEEMRARLVAARPDLDATVELLKSIRLPELARETEYISLGPNSSGGGYEFIYGDITSSDGYHAPCRDYREVIKEYIIPTSTAKHARAKRESFMVGALARFNNNYKQLHPEAKKAAREIGLAAPCHNPYLINAAQLVETVHCLEDSIEAIGYLLDNGLKREEISIKPVGMRGVGIVEAPRGLLIHDYTYNSDGRVAEANCIIPTGQNLANINLDIKVLVNVLIDRPDNELENGLKMLVRAYDPCISCSTHGLAIKIHKRSSHGPR